MLMTTENVADSRHRGRRVSGLWLRAGAQRTLVHFRYSRISFAFISVAVGVFSTTTNYCAVSDRGHLDWIIAFVGRC